MPQFLQMKTPRVSSDVRVYSVSRAWFGKWWHVSQEWVKMQQEACLQGINVPDPPGRDFLL